LASLSFELSKASFQLSQFLVSEMLSGELSSSLMAGWCSIGLIWQTFNIRVCPGGKSDTDRSGGPGDLSDDVNAAKP
jgi:hypothetical protein